MRAHCWWRSSFEPHARPVVLAVDGDGTADFKVPRHPIIFYAKGMLLPVLILLGVQCVFAGLFVAVEADDQVWTCNRRQS